MDKIIIYIFCHYSSRESQNTQLFKGFGRQRGRSRRKLNTERFIITSELYLDVLDF